MTVPPLPAGINWRKGGKVEFTDADLATPNVKISSAGGTTVIVIEGVQQADKFVFVDPQDTSNRDQVAIVKGFTKNDLKRVASLSLAPIPGASNGTNVACQQFAANLISTIKFSLTPIAAQNNDTPAVSLGDDPGQPSSTPLSTPPPNRSDFDHGHIVPSGSVDTWDSTSAKIWKYFWTGPDSADLPKDLQTQGWETEKDREAVMKLYSQKCDAFGDSSVQDAWSSLLALTQTAKIDYVLYHTREWENNRPGQNQSTDPIRSIMTPWGGATALEKPIANSGGTGGGYRRPSGDIQFNFFIGSGGLIYVFPLGCNNVNLATQVNNALGTLQH